MRILKLFIIYDIYSHYKIITELKNNKKKMETKSQNRDKIDQKRKKTNIESKKNNGNWIYKQSEK